MVDNLLSLLKLQQRSTAVVVYRPKEENITFSERKQLQTKLIKLTHGQKENCDMLFLNSCQSKCLRTKLLGYLGAAMFLTEDMQFMILNTLRRDLVETFTYYQNKGTKAQEMFKSKTSCKKHAMIIIQNIPFNTKIAIYYLLNSHNEQIHEIEDEVQFVCDPIYLLLFYKFWNKEISQHDEGIFDYRDESDSDESLKNDEMNQASCNMNVENDQKREKNCDPDPTKQNGTAQECSAMPKTSLISMNHQNGDPDSHDNEQKNHEHTKKINCVSDCGSSGRDHATINKTTVPHKKSIMDKTLSDLFRERGYGHLFETKKEEPKQPDSNFDVAEYTRNYFSLRLTQRSVENGTIFLKLQILLEQEKITLRRSEIVFLYDFFRQTKCTIMKVKIIQVLTRVTNMCNNETWNRAIKNKVNFSGIYSLSTSKLALLFECLKYLLVHKLYDKETDVFLYRLLHAACPNMVFCALKLLRIRKINRRQVIDRCLKLISCDTTALNTLLEYIDLGTYKFTFKRLLEQNLIFEESKKTNIILKRILEVSTDKFKKKLVKKYQFLAKKYHIIALITDEQILSELRDHMMNDLTETSIYFIAEILEKGLGFSKKSDYKDFFERGIEILLRNCQKHMKGQCHKEEHPGIETQIYRDISFLISLGLKHGDLETNKHIFENFLERAECNGIRRLIEENLEFYNFVL